MTTPYQHVCYSITMKTQTIQKGSPNISDIVADVRLRKVLALNFLATGLGTAVILGIGMFLGN